MAEYCASLPACRRGTQYIGRTPERLEPIRIPAHLIPINAPPAEDCALEAMRIQTCANQWISNGFYLRSLQLNWQKIELFKCDRLPVHNLWPGGLWIFCLFIV